jgi:hypothetical protein
MVVKNNMKLTVKELHDPGFVLSDHVEKMNDSLPVYDVYHDIALWWYLSLAVDNEPGVSRMVIG